MKGTTSRHRPESSKSKNRVGGPARIVGGMVPRSYRNTEVLRLGPGSVESGGPSKSSISALDLPRNKPDETTSFIRDWTPSPSYIRKSLRITVASQLAAVLES